MSLSNAGRAQAIYNAVKATNANFSKLSAAEQNQLLTNLQTIFGTGDLTYLVANTVVLPSALQTPAGGLVVTSGGPTNQSGSVTSAVAVTGTGSIS